MNTLTFLSLLGAYWLLLLAAVFLALGAKLRRTVAIIIPALYLSAMVGLFGWLEPWQRLWLGTIGLLFTLKSSILLLQDVRVYAKPGLLAYMTVWPGMEPRPFVARQQPSEDGHRFVVGYCCFWLGACVLCAAAILTSLPALVRLWTGLTALLLMVHFGYADMLSCAVRLLGWDAHALFDAPLKSSSLQDFWSRRWNVAFVEMNKRLFLPLSVRLLKPVLAIPVVFLISGLLHELAISYASGSEWGKPFVYFAVQAAGMTAERHSFFKRLPIWHRRVWTWSWLLIPLPLLFTGSFMNAFIAPLLTYLHNELILLRPIHVLSLALWMAAIGHFCTLGAGLQVPFRLHWKEELARLSNFNRKIMLNYAAYVGLMIVAFGSLTLALHDEILFGEKCAVYLSLLIALFWIVRLLVDIFWFKNSDWPKGLEFVIGHTLLNTLFVALACVYSYVVYINWMARL